MADSLARTLVEFFGTTIPAELTVFIISLLPILELRGGLIAASLLGMDFIPAFLICFAANLLPIPLILFFIRPFFNWLKGTRRLRPLADWMERKVEKNREKVMKYETLGLFLFVAIPLPGTGGWTGALIAAMLDMRVRRAFPTIALGVLVAGVIVSIISYGIPAMLG